jgi:GT2 family glycosyltransferase
MFANLTVITVTHNGGLVIEGLLKSLPGNVRLIVIDNASTDNTLDIVRTVRPDAQIIRNSIGLGYGVAASQGLKAVTTEFALLANPDSLLGEEALTALLSAASDFPDAAMFGPVHKDGKGNIEASHDVTLWNRSRFGKLAYDVVPQGPICVEFLSGAVNLVRMSAIRDVGYYDPEIYLYFEDDDMCLRLRNKGHSLILVANAVVTHLNGGSVRPNRYYYWEKYWNIAWSRIYFEQKHCGRARAIKLALGRGLKFAGKGIVYAFVLQHAKSWRDIARSAGTFAAMLGIRASKLPR